MRWLTVVVAGGVIGFLALRASPYLGEVWWIPQSLGELADRHGVLRNVPAFGLLFLVFSLAMGRSRVRGAIVVAALLALGLELVQARLPNRSADPLDVLASWLGIALGFVIWFVIMRPDRNREAAPNHAAD